jgi:predicted HicB family RNase H-like nuclease
MRIDDELGDAASAAAQAEGITRSRWVARLIERELAGALPAKKPKKFLRGVKRNLHLRCTDAFACAIDTAASAYGMKRNQWIYRRLQGGLVDDWGKVIPSPLVEQELYAANALLHRLGVNINQIAHAANSAAQSGNDIQILECAEQTLTLKTEIWKTIEVTQDRLIELKRKDQFYWRSECSSVLAEHISADGTLRPQQCVHAVN